jgi:predicted transcriptional regulator of viral defense system
VSGIAWIAVRDRVEWVSGIAWNGCPGSRGICKYHGIGTQIPAAVQIALPRGVKAPRIAYPRIERFSMSAEAMTAGVEEHDMDGTPIRVFDLAKTVADCFKYRNRIGQDVAIEALQETIRSRRATPAQVMRYAKVDRVEQVMRPYVEALM